MSGSKPNEDNKYFGWVSKGHVWIGIGVCAAIVALSLCVASAGVPGWQAAAVPLGFGAFCLGLILIVALCVGGKPYQPVKATQDADPKYQRELDKQRKRT